MYQLRMKLPSILFQSQTFQYPVLFWRRTTLNTITTQVKSCFIYYLLPTCSTYMLIPRIPQTNIMTIVLKYYIWLFPIVSNFSCTFQLGSVHHHSPMRTLVQVRHSFASSSNNADMLLTLTVKVSIQIRI